MGACLKLTIPHVSHRQGRPRFNPGPKLRALGFKGRDLRHPAGAWYTAEEALQWVRDELSPEIERRRQAKAAGQRVRAPGRKVYSLQKLLADWQASRTWRQDLGAKTRHWYGQMLAVLAAEAPELLAEAAAGLTKPQAFNLYESLADARGVATARGVLSAVSSAYSWAILRGRVKMPADMNPCHRLQMEGPAARVRAGEVPEMAALVAAADAIGRPEIGDMIVLALWSGQRQADRLALVEGAAVDGRRFFRQAKTGAIVMVPDAPELADRLAAAKARRQALTLQFPHVIVDETTGKPFTADRYRKLYAEVRAAAVEGGAGLAPCPSLADFTDQDLRDTAVTWLARAGATDPEIAAVTGHSLASVKRVLKHYLAMHPELAEHGIAKMAAWHQAKRNS